MIEDYDDLMELMDKLELAIRYNEPDVLFKDVLLTTEEAQSIVNQFLEGGKRGSKK